MSDHGAGQDVSFPVVRAAGSATDCGRALGWIWEGALRAEAATKPAGSAPWWRHPRYQRLVEHYTPYLPELYVAMAKAARVPEEQIGTRAPADLDTGCTSFAIAPDATLAEEPISGQTKDTPLQRRYQFQVLALRIDDGPGMLSLTYPGWLFGHGFVRGGCAIFRNSLYAGDSGRGLPYGVWGLLALHCPTVEHVIELTEREGCREGQHCTVADEQGGIVGLENTAAGLGILRPRAGLYTHANAVCAANLAAAVEKEGPHFHRPDSLHRQSRLYGLLAADQGRLTPQLVLRALADHDGYPVSICRHQDQEAQTTAAVIAEPTRDRLHVCAGHPCRHWAGTYALS